MTAFTKANNVISHKDSHSHPTCPLLLHPSLLLSPSLKKNTPNKQTRKNKEYQVMIDSDLIFLGMWMKELASKGLAKNNLRAWSLLSSPCHFWFHYWVSSRTVEPAKRPFSPICWAQWASCCECWGNGGWGIGWQQRITPAASKNVWILQRESNRSSFRIGLIGFSKKKGHDSVESSNAHRKETCL